MNSVVSGLARKSTRCSTWRLSSSRVSNNASNLKTPEFEHSHEAQQSDQADGGDWGGRVLLVEAVAAWPSVGAVRLLPFKKRGRLVPVRCADH